MLAGADELVVLDFPAFDGEAVLGGGPPGADVGAVEEELVAEVAFAWGEGVGHKVDLRDGVVKWQGPFFGLIGYDSQVSPFDGEVGEGLVFANVVDLEGDEAIGGHVVDEVGAGYAVEEGSEVWSDGFDAEVVPLAVFEGVACFGVGGEWVEPATSCFVVDAGGPGAFGGVGFDLVAVHAAVVVGGVAEASDLDAGVEAWGDEHVVFKDEVGVGFIGAEEGVCGIGGDATDDESLLGVVLCFSAALGPAGEVGAVEEGFPGCVGGGESGKAVDGGQEDNEGEG